MRRFLVMFLLSLLTLTFLQMVIPAGGEMPDTRAPGPDLYPVVNLPVKGGLYQTENGLKGNVTLWNTGTEWANNTGSIGLSIRNKATGEVVFNAISIQFSHIGPGENRTFLFQNWTSASAGQYICNITVSYLADVDKSNNFMENGFSMWTKYWPYPPKFEKWSVEPSLGDIDTEFKFNVEYKHNVAPDAIKVELDGVNITMQEQDIGDTIYQDGKVYTFKTKLSVGVHRHRFFGEVSGWNDLNTSISEQPWVNLSLKNPALVPHTGWVTTAFQFSVEYGSVLNRAPDEIYVIVNDERFDLTRDTPTPNYYLGNVKFMYTVLGYDLVPSPLIYSFHARTGGDQFSLGPFPAAGPSMTTVNVSGTVTDLEAIPLQGVKVSLEPGTSATTDAEGHYLLTSYIGNPFIIRYSKQGYLNESYEIKLLNDRQLDIDLEGLPIGGTVSGYALWNWEGAIQPVSGAVVNLTGPLFTAETVTESDGLYMIPDVPAGSGYTLKVSEPRFITASVPLVVQNGMDLRKNITLTERDMGISVAPAPEDAPIPVSSVFDVACPGAPDASTLDIVLMNASGQVATSLVLEPNATALKVVPDAALLYNTNYTLKILPGLKDLDGDLMVWRELDFAYRTSFQPLGVPTSDPPPDSSGLPLDQVFNVSFGIGIAHGTVSVSLFDMDSPSGELPVDLSFTDTVNWSGSGRTDTTITIAPGSLGYSTRYLIEISDLLRDLYGRAVLQSPFSIEFRTTDEPDRDDDGVPDSTDLFPDDPLEWADGDGDGHGDNGDVFPDDVAEWSDMDGDGVGDNGDTDMDGDGIPDSWEIENDLDPADPDDAFADPDDDGFTNLEEFMEDTDPQDKGDHPDEGGDDGEWILYAVVIVIALLVIAALALIFFLRGGSKPEPTPAERPPEAAPGAMEAPPEPGTAEAAPEE